MSKKPTKKTTKLKKSTPKSINVTAAPAPTEQRSGPTFNRFRAFGVAAILLIGLVTVIVGLAIGKDDNSKQTDTDMPKDGATVTVTGEYVCLPHKDTTGPQTDECAFGLKTDGGVYYGLNFADLSELGDLATGDRLRVTGEFEEKESIYQSIGTLSVDEAKEL